ncbi:MAG: zinc-binding dehydrogenase [Chloroflexi bacterium]|nr:zinc-binding dehydrogenase [Chloroflexota bacterium]
MKYRHVLATAYGPPEVLQVFESDVPEPAANEIRVKVLAAGVAWGDVARRQAPQAAYPSPPFPLGYDVVGVVDKLGTGVTQFSVGQHVAGLTFAMDTTTGMYRLFGYSEMVCVLARMFVPIPDHLDPAMAVCLVLNYMTAYQILHDEARAQTGETLLVHGGGGGVGTALLQLGRLMGLKVFATGSSAKQSIIQALGALPIDYTTQDFTEVVQHTSKEGLDIVIDPIGGDYVGRSYRLLRPNGRLIVYGLSSMSGEDVAQHAGAEIERINAFAGNDPTKTVKFFAGVDDESDHYHSDLNMLFEWLAGGKIQPIIARRLTLNQAPLAHHLLETRQAVGKIVFDLTQS